MSLTEPFGIEILGTPAGYTYTSDAYTKNTYGSIAL